jgi:hypothetical protein
MRFLLLVCASVLGCSGAPSTSSSSSSSGASSSNGVVQGRGMTGTWGTDLYAPHTESWGGRGETRAIAIAIDRTYGLYVAGTFENAMEVQGVTLNANGRATFLLHMLPDGSLAWMRALEGSLALGNPALWPIFQDDSGCVLVGQFEGTLTVGDRTLSSLGSTDIFLLGVGPNGETRFLKRLGGAGTETVGGISAEGMVSGTFEQTMDVATGLVTSLGGRDGFVVQVDPFGLLGEATRVGGPDDEAIHGAARASTGEIIVAGSFAGTLTYQGTTAVSAGGRDMFVAAVASAGSQTWMQSYGGAADDAALTVMSSRDASRTVVLLHHGGPGSVGATAIPAQGFSVVALESDGTVASLHTTGIHVRAMTYSPSLRPVLLGEFTGSVTEGAFTMTSQGGVDIALVTVGFDGTPVAARAFGSEGDDVAGALDISGLGMVRAVGASGRDALLFRTSEQ